MRADADNIRSHSIIFFWSKGSSESDEACILLSFDKPHQLFTVKADILTWKQQIKSISTCSRQEAEKCGGGAPGSGTGSFNCIIMWNQSQTKAFIGTLNSHLAGCSTGCLQGCWAAWAAGPAGEEFSAAASSLDLQKRENKGADPGSAKQQQQWRQAASSRRRRAKQILPPQLPKSAPSCDKVAETRSDLLWFGWRLRNFTDGVTQLHL